jgi:hypothetical protein
VKTATEKSSSASAANASTLGDSTDVLAALKAKMEKTEKNNFLIFLNIKARSNAFFFYFIFILLFIAILLPRLASGYKGFPAIRLGISCSNGTYILNYILQQGLMSVREDRSYNFKTVKNDFIIELGDMLEALFKSKSVFFYFNKTLIYRDLYINLFYFIFLKP